MKRVLLHDNITKAKFFPDVVHPTYIGNFQLIEDVDMSLMRFDSLQRAKALVSHFPSPLCEVTVANKDAKEVLSVAQNLNARKVTVNVASDHNTEQILCGKRFGTPSPVNDEYEEEMERIQLLKSRKKYTYHSPAAFIPEIILKRFPQLNEEH